MCRESNGAIRVHWNLSADVARRWSFAHATRNARNFTQSAFKSLASGDVAPWKPMNSGCTINSIHHYNSLPFPVLVDGTSSISSSSSSSSPSSLITTVAWRFNVFFCTRLFPGNLKNANECFQFIGQQAKCNNAFRGHRILLASVTCRWPLTQAAHNALNFTHCVLGTQSSVL